MQRSKTIPMGIRPATGEYLPAILEIFNHEIQTSFDAYDTVPLRTDEQHGWFETYRSGRLPEVEIFNLHLD